MLKQLSDVLRNVREETPTLPLDTRVPPFVRVLNGALDEDEESATGLVLHGRLDPNTLRFLKVDDYQRPLGDRSDIFTALKDGVVVPPVEIGVRGQDFETAGDNFIIKSPAYIIDGWQRVGTAMRLLEMLPNHPVRLFATFHFGTDTLWERHRFTDLNKNIKKVSPNLHLRNVRDKNEAILTLYGLSTNTPSFPLYQKVSWSQNMKRGDLISAFQLVKVSLRLHGHLAGQHSSTELAAASLQTAAGKTKLDQFRKNVHAFYEVMDECWPFANVELRHSAPQVKQQFQSQLARLFSSHIDFWDTGDRVFFVSAILRRKLAKFPLNDPHIRNLAGSGGRAGHILYDMLLKHMNSGKRTGHLRSRYDAE